MILIIDNYDSFVYNLARYVEELGHDVHVVRNDKVTLEDLNAYQPSHIIISPGPCTPNEAGVSLDVIKHLGENVPILGVCLGHQAIGQAYGGRVVKAKRPMHGKRSALTHDGLGILEGLANPLQVARYHSLVVDTEGLPDDLEVTMSSPEGEIMALQHRTYPVFGVQFHPESVLTVDGYGLLENFLAIKGV